MSLIQTIDTLNHQFYYDVLANPDGTRVLSLEDVGNAGLINLRSQQNLRETIRTESVLICFFCAQI